MLRVRYGQEPDDRGVPGACDDCGVIRGEFHVPGCEVARCPVCGGQVGVCECDRPDLDDGEA